MDGEADEDSKPSRIGVDAAAAEEKLEVKPPRGGRQKLPSAREEGFGINSSNKPDDQALLYLT